MKLHYKLSWKSYTSTFLPFLPLNFCNWKFFSWQWTMTSQFWILMAIYHSYHWPYSVWYYWPWAPIWKKSLFALVLWYISMLIWILFSVLSLSSFWCILYLLSVRYGHPLRLRVLPLFLHYGRVQRAFHASHLCLFFSSSNVPTVISVLVILTWTINSLLTGPLPLGIALSF